MRELEAHEILTLNLRRLTAEKHMPLTVVADRAQIPRRELFDALSGDYDPDVPWLERLAEAMDVRLWELVRDEHYPPNSGT